MFTAIIRLLGSLLLVCALPWTAAGDDNCLKLVVSTGLEHLNPIVDNVKFAANREGVCISIVRVPTVRGKHLVKDGEADGLFFQTEKTTSLISDYAIPVPEPLGYADFVVVSKSEEYSTIEEISAGEVGFLYGWKWPPEMLGDRPYQTAKTMDQLIAMHEHGRIGAILTDRMSWELNRSRPKSWKVSSLNREKVYLVLGKHKADYIDPINKALIDYKSEYGTLLADHISQ